MDMLDDYKKKIKDEQVKKIKKNIKWINLKTYIIKNKWKIITFILILVVIIFPTYSGTIIGKWIHNFIGSILANI